MPRQRLKILIGVNTLTEVNQMVYMNHAILYYRLGRNFKNIDFTLCAPRRMQIDNMRNFCAKAAIEGNFDYLWFIDDDVLVREDALTHLLALKTDVAAGITLIRGYPFHPMLFSFKPGRATPYLDEYQKVAAKDGSIRKNLGAVGFSCCLIKVSVLEQVEAPWFLTGPGFTEDVFFCQRAAHFKKDLSIAATLHVQTEHILGSQVISPATRKAQLRYHEILNPNIKEQMKNANGIIVQGAAMDELTATRGIGIAHAYTAKKSA